MFECNAMAQTDTIIAENIFKYEILDGKRTANKQVIEQKTYNLQGKLIRQIKFKDSIMEIEKYIAFFYNNEDLISVETFHGGDSLTELKRYSYESNGIISYEFIYHGSFENMKLVQKSKYIYDDTILVKKVIYNRKNKWLKKINYTYTGNKEIKSMQYRRESRDDKLKSKQKISLVKNGSPQSSEIIYMYYTGETKNIHIEYQYDLKINKIVKEIWTNSTDSVLKIIESSYSPDRIKKSELIVDASGKYIEFKVFKRKTHVVNLKKIEMYDLKNTD